MQEAIHLTPAQVAAGVHERFDPAYWSVEWSADRRECALRPCRKDAGVEALCGEDMWLDFV